MLYHAATGPDILQEAEKTQHRILDAEYNTVEVDPFVQASEVRLSEVGGLTMYSRDKIYKFINLNIVLNFKTNIMETQTFFTATIKLIYSASCNLCCARVTCLKSSISVFRFHSRLCYAEKIF
jgi:hypothetical protein